MSIEHVGSTSIPGLVAKPILDIGIICREEDLPAVRVTMVQGGYLDRGDLAISSCVAFRQPSVAGLMMKRNTSVMADGCLSLRNHMDVRRTLLEDMSSKDTYARVKKELVAKGVADVDAYQGRRGGSQDDHVCTSSASLDAASGAVSLLAHSLV